MNNEHFVHSGAWGLAIIMIVLVSWFLYQYLAPRTWRDWAGAGGVQAFIIALYAEMYGFPLTIYLLVRFFGLDRAYVNANLWSKQVRTTRQQTARRGSSGAGRRARTFVARRTWFARPASE